VSQLKLRPGIKVKPSISSSHFFPFLEFNFLNLRLFISLETMIPYLRQAGFNP